MNKPKWKAKVGIQKPLVFFCTDVKISSPGILEMDVVRADGKVIKNFTTFIASNIMWREIEDGEYEDYLKTLEKPNGIKEGSIPDTSKPKTIDWSQINSES